MLYSALPPQPSYNPLLPLSQEPQAPRMHTPPPTPSRELQEYRDWKQSKGLSDPIMPVEKTQSDISIALKIKYSFYAALGFFVLSNPVTYRFVNEVLGFFMGPERGFYDPEKCAATPKGIFLHTFLFFLLMIGMMSFPKDR